MGDWVLMTAVNRTEAGQLHALGGKPVQTHISDYPWKICVVAPSEENASPMGQIDDMKLLPEGMEAKLSAGISFRYAYAAATQTPSKQTATDRKGRQKDMEVAEDTHESILQTRSWRRPSFLTREKQGSMYGNAIHAAMQYIRYENCGSMLSVEQEIIRLVQEGFLSEDQGKLVKCEQLANFFETDIGKKLRSGMACLREFKFSILDDASNYGHGLEGEEVLLQGVVDCALLESDGITVLDFKTDYVTEATLPTKVDCYRAQVWTYGEALSRIYEMPIKKRYLYFFCLNRFVEV